MGKEDLSRKPSSAEARQRFQARRISLMALGYGLGLKGRALQEQVDHLLNREDLTNLYEQVQKTGEYLKKTDSKKIIDISDKLHQIGITFLQDSEGIHKSISSAIGMQILNICVEDTPSNNLAWTIGLIANSGETKEKIQEYFDKYQKPIAKVKKS